MRKYIAYYKGKKIEVEAESSYAAQTIAAEQFKVKKQYQVSVFLADVEHSPNIL